MRVSLSAVIFVLSTILSSSLYAQENLEVLGVGVGDLKEDAERKMAEAIKGLKIRPASQSLIKGSYESPVFDLGIEGESTEGDSFSRVSVVFDQKRKGQVVGISRSLQFPSNELPTKDALLGQLKAKFGAPTFHLLIRGVYGSNKITESVACWVKDPSFKPKDEEQGVKQIREVARNLSLLMNVTNYFYVSYENIKPTKFLVYSFSHDSSNDSLVRSLGCTLEDTARIAESIVSLRNFIDGQIHQKKEMDQKKGAEVKVNL